MWKARVIQPQCDRNHAVLVERLEWSTPVDEGFADIRPH